MKKLVTLTGLIACVVCMEVEAQVDRDQDANAPCVLVQGAVHAPLRIALKGKMIRLSEALALAGGSTTFAAGTLRLMRTNQPCYAEAWAHKTWPDRPLKITELTIEGLRCGNEGADPYLSAGDVVLVVESDPIYVSGSVEKPPTIYFKEPPALLKAIALAGGAVRSIGETKVVIFRAGGDGRYKEFFRINLSELKKHPKRSPLLHGNDIVDVGPSGIIRRMNPPIFDSPPFDNRPSPDRAKSWIPTHT